MPVETMHRCELLAELTPLLEITAASKRSAAWTTGRLQLLGDPLCLALAVDPKSPCLDDRLELLAGLRTAFARLGVTDWDALTHKSVSLRFARNGWAPHITIGTVAVDAHVPTLAVLTPSVIEVEPVSVRNVTITP